MTPSLANYPSNPQRPEVSVGYTSGQPQLYHALGGMLLGIFWILRAGEFTVTSNQSFDAGAQLTPADISVDRHDGPSVMCVSLKQSKTDPFRVGVSVFLG